jgi:hypothetical protein
MFNHVWTPIYGSVDKIKSPAVTRIQTVQLNIESGSLAPTRMHIVYM